MDMKTQHKTFHKVSKQEDLKNTASGHIVKFSCNCILFGLVFLKTKRN